MSDSDDEDYAFFGNPLEAFDEDAVPRKKPISVEDQIATDKHGKRRFHGAFTGGFSAGFFNSVGSLEGFKPSTFKSSRNERTNYQLQLPTHFMDEEDTDEFGIAPQVVRTKAEYSSTKRKRERILNSGPIPGEPVLKSILKPAKHTMGILLLMKMGWKPGQDIGERLQRKTNKEKPSSTGTKTKVYGCARGPQDSSFSNAIAVDSDSDLEEEIYRELGAKAPSFRRKEDNMGLGYKGLDRSTLNFNNKTPKTLTIKDQFNKTIKISGQAFGVGAFEEDDDDIYSTEDKSQYDFSLEPLRKPNKKSNNLPAITSGSNVIIGFVKASFKESLKQYPGPLIPATFTGEHIVRKSKFDMPPQGGIEEPRRQRLDADLRSVILGTQQLPVRIKEEKLDDETREKSLPNPESNKTSEKHSEITTKSSSKGSSGWKPFASDSAKQERYERYLNLVKIGAKDLVCTILLNTMSDLERESELREFECAARLYSGQIMSDRFTHGVNLEDDKNIKPESTQENKRERQRLTTEWSPHPLVCKRFNIKPPDNATGTTLKSVAESKKKPKFSVFDFLNTSKSTDLLNMVESNAASNADREPTDREIKCEILTGLAAGNTETQSNGNQSISNTTQSKNNSSNILSADDEDFEEPEDKMDLFKAIFLDSDEGSGDEGEKQNGVKNDENLAATHSDNRIGETINLLRNTSPPRGIFANLDLDKMVNKKQRDVESLKSASPPKSIFDKDKEPENSQITVKTEAVEMPEDSYGPSLPSEPLDKPKSRINLKLDVNDGRWVEKQSKEKRHKSKHRHHKKKHKKEKKRDKHKKKKKKNYSSSESSSDSD